MATQHTPGPWQADERCDVYGADGTRIALVGGNGRNADANARLIAAVPEMREFIAFIAAGQFAPSDIHREAMRLLASIEGGANG